jgi:hypothetical protein
MNAEEERELRQKAVVAADAIASAVMWRIFKGFLIAIAFIVLLILGAMWQQDIMNHHHWTHHEDATGKWIPDKWQ